MVEYDKTLKNMAEYVFPNMAEHGQSMLWNIAEHGRKRIPEHSGIWCNIAEHELWKMAEHVFRNMVEHSKLLQIATNNSKWLQMALNGSKWL